jgi:sensor histidine kinase regulating citrate/malate metabolism
MSADSFRLNVIAAMQSDNLLTNEEHFTFSDGHTKRLEITKTDMLDQNGNVLGVLGIGHNITNYQQIAENL